MEDSTEKKEIHYRVSKTTGVLMIYTALFIDVLEMLLEWMIIGLVLNYFITIFAGLLFWLWFAIKGVPFWVKPSRLITLGITFLAELIPGLDATGFGEFWTVGILILVILVRLEDRTGIDLTHGAPKIDSKVVSEALSNVNNISGYLPKNVSPKVSDIITNKEQKSA